jgi:divalent metal cation (Fe/Co/Zn/Cd) transporter
MAETLPDIKSIVTHMEPVGERSASREAAPGDEEQVRRVLQTIAADHNLGCRFYDLEVRRLEDGLSVSFRCSVDASTAVAEAHRLTERVERALRDRLPGLGRVVIHEEPAAPPKAA